MSLEPYVFPPFPSHQVKVVQEYLKYYSEFDFDRLSGLSTDNFTQLTLPASLGLSVRTKIEELGFLKDLQSSVGGKTLQVSKFVTQVEYRSVLTANLFESSPSTVSTMEWGRLGSMYAPLSLY
jgi:hypothetical protein